MRLQWLLALAVSPLGAQTLWTPEHFWKQDSAFAGAKACAGCHAEIYKKQEASNHARSLRPLTEVSEITSRLPFEIFATDISETAIAKARAGTYLGAPLTAVSAPRAFKVLM